MSHIAEHEEAAEAATGETPNNMLEDPRDRATIIADGRRKIDAMKLIFENSNDPFIDSLRTRNPNVVIEIRNAIPSPEGDLRGNTPRGANPPKILLNAYQLGLQELSLAAALKTLIHEYSHVDIQRISLKRSNFEPDEVDVFIRLSNITNSIFVNGVVVKKGTEIPLEGFENVNTVEKLEALKKEYEHIIIVESYADDQAAALKRIVEADPETYGTIMGDLSTNPNAFKALALGDDANKDYYIMMIFLEMIPLTLRF